ncbi:MAG: diacylglycerol kinase family lipid kinase [Bacteroidales bacterium]
MNTEKKKIVAIINPISGIRPKDNLPTLIREQIDSDKFDIKIVFTEYAGHATEIASQAVIDKIDYVLAIGGDGTINETAKALIHSETALGIIPLGSGNGLARHLEIPLETSKALRIINEENVIAIDYCKANDHIFFCTAGLGFDAWISKKFAEDKHRGSLTYIKNVLAEYLRYEPRHYKIISEEGTVVEKAFLVACANASQYGNNAYIAPGANMQDGLMDITVLRPFNHLEAPVLSVQLFTKQLSKNSKIQTFRDKSVKIILEKEEVMHVDGEPIMMGKEITVKTIPAGLKILVPTNPSHSLIEPIQHVIEEIHYNFVSDIKDVFSRK